tara:strand:+ start:450 stop:731 length:282 start_codon:yes stop_codon:yes gene_type:complete
MTLSEKLIRSHYVGLNEKWDRGKISEFCKLLNITIDELAAYLNMSVAQAKTCFKKGKFPGSACVLLDLWENYYIFKTTGLPLREQLSPVDKND